MDREQWKQEQERQKQWALDNAREIVELIFALNEAHLEIHHDFSGVIVDDERDDYYEFSSAAEMVKKAQRFTH